MPNWCHNDLWVFGDGEQIDALLDAVTDHTTGAIEICKSLLPVPDALPEGEIICDSNGEPMFQTLTNERYQWTLENWGVKWGDCDTIVERLQWGLAQFRYDTPWSPMTTAIENISMLWPELVFTEQFHEPGMQMLGVNGIENGVTHAAIEAGPNEYPAWDEDDIDGFYRSIDLMLDQMRRGLV